MARKWTDEEIEYIRQHAGEMPCYELLDKVNAEFGKNYSLDQLYRVKARCNIRSPNIGCFRKGIRNSPETEYKKGQIPWNKGMHYHAGGRSVETQFKKGNIPKNHRPVGSERISYGRIQIKIAEPNVWENLTTLVWQSANKRALPRGYVIKFANCDGTDYSPENLVAITRAQNAVINHLGIKPYDADSLKAALLIADIRLTRGKRKNESPKHGRRYKKKE